MSDQTTKRAWEAFIYGLPVEAIPANVKPANFKAVALCLGYHSDWNTLQNMSASMVTVAAETSLHRNTVDKVVTAMVEMGLASQREGKRSWGSKKWTYVYDLHIPNVSHLSVSPSLEADSNVSHLSVSPSVGNDSHSEQRLTFTGNDSHLEGNDSHLSVNNHTYNLTYNHSNDEPVSVLASSDETQTRTREDSQSKEKLEDSQTLSGPPTLDDVFGGMERGAAQAPNKLPAMLKTQRTNRTSGLPTCKCGALLVEHQNTGTGKVDGWLCKAMDCSQRFKLVKDLAS